MSKYTRSLFWPIAFSLVLSPPAIASEEVPLGSFADRIDVEIVNIEVFVTDQEGRRVRDLSKEDFELYEDGRPVEITNFYAVTRPPVDAAEPLTAAAENEPPAAAAPQQLPEEQKLRLMIYVDHYHTLPNERTRVLAPLGEFLAKRLVQGDELMLVGYGGELEVIQPFTGDRRLIAEALAKLHRTVTRLPAQQMAGKLASKWANMAAANPFSAGGGAHTAGHAQEAGFRLHQSINSLDRAVRSLGSLPGRKAILYVSAGLPLGGLDNRNRFRRIARTANAHRVTFYALDARGGTDSTLSAIYSGDEVGGASRTIRQGSGKWARQEPLLMMAAPTGGSVILNTYNFAGTLSRMSEDFDTFYSLGYASRSTGEVKYHKIEVKLRRPGLTARHRHGYLERPLAERIADRTVSSLVLDREVNPLGIELAFDEAEKQHAEEFLLPILVRIPLRGVSLVPRDEVAEGRLRIYVVVRDEVGHFSPVRELFYPVTILRDHLEQARDGDVGYQTTLRIRPGTQQVAVGIWDEISGAESFVRSAVVVGEAE